MTSLKTKAGPLTFEYDLNDPEVLVTFPQDFAQFLARYSTLEDVEAFLALLERYFKATALEDLNFATVCNIAAKFADIVDTSGVPFDKNEFFNYDAPAKTAEDILAEEDARDERDVPHEVIPSFPEVEVIVAPRDDVAMIVYRAIMGLKDSGYRRAAANLRSEARQLMRTRPLMLEMLRLVESYVFVDYILAIEHNEAEQRKARRR